MRKRLIVIGIDSLDPVMIERFRERLPNIWLIANKGTLTKMESVFPPDSIPAWISIFTGQLPSDHGIIHSFDVFQSDWKNILAIDPASFKDKTFWETLGREGYKSTILFPQLCYPPWAINGVMVSRSLHHEVASCPDGILTEDERRNLGGFSGMHPGKKNLEKYYDNVVNVTRREADFALRMAKSTDWDLFFVFFAWLDIVCHFFWRYMDRDDPRYPGRNKHENYIPDYYSLLDQIVGSFHAEYPNSAIMVFGDHGHGMRPPRTVNINVMLRKNHLLTERGRTGVKSMMQETLKRALLETVMKLELDDWMLRLSKKKILAGASKDVYLSGSLVSDVSKARLSSFAGPKSYSFGGVEIARNNMSAEEYEEVRTCVISQLEALCNPATGERLVKWAERRERLFVGEFVYKYPDILFELAEGYGVYWATRGPIIGNSYEHNLSSGGHKSITALASCGISVLHPMKCGLPRVIDLYPTIQHFFGLRTPQEMYAMSSPAENASERSHGKPEADS